MLNKNKCTQNKRSIIAHRDYLCQQLNHITVDYLHQLVFVFIYSLCKICEISSTLKGYDSEILQFFMP
jgi:hypothetical protein